MINYSIDTPFLSIRIELKLSVPVRSSSSTYCYVEMKNAERFHAPHKFKLYRIMTSSSGRNVRYSNLRWKSLRRRYTCGDKRHRRYDAIQAP